MCTVVPQPLGNDPRFTQSIYCYGRASKRFVEVYRPKQLSVMQEFFVCFDFFDGIMFKIERASKYKKINCFSKILINFFKIEKTQNRSSVAVKNNFTFHQLL